MPNNGENTWKDRLTEWISRPYRLALWVVILAIAFAAGRFVFLLALALFAFVRGIKYRRVGGARLSLIVAALLGVLIVAHIISYVNSRRIERFVQANTPIDLAEIPDGTYYGTGQGANGEISLAVTIGNHAIDQVDLLEYRDAAYAFDDVMAVVRGAKNTDFADIDSYVFRNKESIAGFLAALHDALVPMLPDYPTPGKLVATTFYITSNKINRITINALAILFIVLLTFDFAIQPTLAPGTGPSLNCYNCQACVGVCPVKMVDGEPFPMIMVLEARLGNYERVAELAKFCVACGNCAAKCPVGNSGPVIASSSYVLWRDEMRRYKKKQERALRDVPSIEEQEREHEA